MVSKFYFTLISALLSFSCLTLAEEPSFPYPTGDDDLQNQYIVEFKRNQAGEASKKNLLSKQNEEREPKLIKRIGSRNISVLKFPSKRAAGRWMQKNMNGIQYFEKDALMYPFKLNSKEGVTRNLAETTPYGIGHVQAEDVPDANSGSRKVCIIDSGYDRNHEDLPDDPALVTGVSFVGNRFPWYEDDNGGHGTHVAGTIAAIGGNNKGVKGVISNGLLKIHAVRVFPPSGSTATSTIIAGFQECVDAGANVINMSLGGGGAQQSFQDAIDDAHSKGILVFAAAGNSGRSAKEYPASYNHVTSVASITESYTKSSFSTFNNAVDIAAPGSDVLSTLPNNRYAEYSGTSMACPHAAGVAALVWSNFPTVPADTIISTLEATALDLPLNSNDGKDNNFGHGLIQAKAAYDALLALDTPTLSPAPSAMPVAFCADGVVVEVDVKTDLFSSETSWEITDSSGDVVASQSSFLNRQLQSETVCLDETATCDGSDYTFTIYDEFGDGICCTYGNGYYEVFVDGELSAEGSQFGTFESTSLCTTTEPPAPTCDIGGKSVCNGTDGCYWSGADRQCFGCSTLGRNKCGRITQCSWNSATGICE